MKVYIIYHCVDNQCLEKEIYRAYGESKKEYAKEEVDKLNRSVADSDIEWYTLESLEVEV